METITSMILQCLSDEYFVSKERLYDRLSEERGFAGVPLEAFNTADEMARQGRIISRDTPEKGYALWNEI